MIPKPYYTTIYQFEKLLEMESCTNYIHRAEDLWVLAWKEIKQINNEKHQKQ